MITIASQITGADQRKHQSSASPVNSPHKGPRKKIPFDGVIMNNQINVTFVICCTHLDIDIRSMIYDLSYTYDYYKKST